jgi:hypothetical protein
MRYTEQYRYSILASKSSAPDTVAYLILPCTDVAYDLCTTAGLAAVKWQDFMEIVAQQTRKCVHVKKIRCTLRQKKPHLHTLEQLAEKIDAQIRTSASKNAF